MLSMGMFAWASHGAASGADWRYVIGQPRVAQQANFCSTRESVAEIARIFMQFGPRTGYAALSASPDCAIAVRSFTPRALVASVTIAEGKHGEYALRFVEVEEGDNKMTYLVTTRDVLSR